MRISGTEPSSVILSHLGLLSHLSLNYRGLLSHLPKSHLWHLSLLSTELFIITISDNYLGYYIVFGHIEFSAIYLLIALLNFNIT